MSDEANPIVYTESDCAFMQRALELARLAEGRTSPNPLVGCVITQNGRIIGEGYHHKAGEPHAEVNALQAAGMAARGATAYVTLEPCSHFGRTPPCADALIRAGIGKVYAAMRDPNPLVAGKGLQRLKEAGIEVSVGLLRREAERLNEVFLKAVTTGLPFVVYKSALTLDGKISTATGDAKWVSSEKSRELSHRYRNLYDVIMVGRETVRLDDPRLTCRLPGGKDPVRLVIDGKLSLSENAQLLSSSPAPCIIATSQAASPEKIEKLRSYPGVEIWQYPAERHVPLPSLLRDLVQRGWTSVLLEGGGTLAGHMLKEKLIDKVEFFIAPKFIGGGGPSPFSGLRIPQMAEAIALARYEASLETGDIHVTGYLN